MCFTRCSHGTQAVHITRVLLTFSLNSSKTIATFRSYLTENILVSIIIQPVRAADKQSLCAVIITQKDESVSLVQILQGDVTR